MDSVLKEQIMINQFVMAVGSTREQARQLLQSSSWQFETALSIFLQEAVPNHHSNNHFSHLRAPANTPATPPAFPDALAAFSRMSTNERSPSSPMEGMSPPPQPVVQNPSCQQMVIQQQPSPATGQMPMNRPFMVPSQPLEICANTFQNNNR